METPDLFPEYGRGITAVESPAETAAEAFTDFDRTNPHIYRLIEREALAAYRRGVRKWSIQGIYEVMRWKRSFVTAGEYKLNHNWKSFYVRKLIIDHPVLRAMFEIRRSPEADELYPLEETDV